MASNRVGILDERERDAGNQRLEAEQARVRRRVEALERGDYDSLFPGESPSLHGRLSGSDSPVTGNSEATDEDVAAAVRAVEERGRSIRPF